MKAKSEFDNAYMRALYERGYQVGQTPAAWDKEPPDYDR
jgi:hypothetical protein